MAGEENNQQTNTVDVAAIIAAALAAGGASTGSGSVYLGGTSGTRPVQMKRTGQTVNIPIPKVTTIKEANSLYLNDPKVRSAWTKTMKKFGLETGNPLIERKAWETAVAGASDWYTTSGGTAQVTPEQYLQWWVGGQKKAGPALPSRSIYQYSPEQLASKIDETAQNLLGRAITDADKTASWYQDLNKALNKMVMQGTVTTTQKVKNPKTGKMENVTIQKPEVTAESLGQTITSALSAADPAALERKKNLDFANWAFNKMGG